LLTKQQQIQNRLRVLQAQIRKHSWDALWIVSPANRQYVTGFTGSAGWVIIPAKGRAVLITDGRYLEQAGKECLSARVLLCSVDPHQCLVKFLQKNKISRLGFEDEQVTVRSWKQLQRSYKGVRGYNASGFVEAVRLCKDQQEQRYLRQAIHIAEKAYARVLPQIKPGIREIDVVQKIEKEMIDAGGQGVAFPTIVASGPNSSLPHAHPGQRRLRAGDLVVIDFGCKYKGYHSDLTRTIAIARMTVKQKELYKTVKKAQIFAKNELNFGSFAAKAHEKAVSVFKKAKIEKYFVHGLGHGIGLEIHEAPKLSALSKDYLDKGMIVTCEPGIYIAGWGGIRIEDDILVDETAAKWLSHSSDDLQVVGRK